MCRPTLVWNTPTSYNHIWHVAIAMTQQANTATTTPFRKTVWDMPSFFDATCHRVAAEALFEGDASKMYACYLNSLSDDVTK